MGIRAKGRLQVASTSGKWGVVWKRVREVLHHNNAVADKVLWCLEHDRARIETRMPGLGRFDKWFHLALCWEWWAVVQYRFGYWAHHRAIVDLPQHPVLRAVQIWQQAAILRLAYLTDRIAEALSGARLNPLAEIGPGLLLMHTGSCGIGGGARIGTCFTMHQDCNIVQGSDGGWATIGDRVTLYSGARVIGAVTIGDEARVGANAVVTHDLPPGCLALGAPACPYRQGEAVPRAAGFLLHDLAETLRREGGLEQIGEGAYRDPLTGWTIQLVTGDGPQS
jgi:serine acetyltransferase